MAVEVSVLESEDQVEDPDEHWQLGVGQREVHPLTPDVVTTKIRSNIRAIFMLSNGLKVRTRNLSMKVRHCSIARAFDK